MQPLKFDIIETHKSGPPTFSIMGIEDSQDLRRFLGLLDDSGVELAEPIGDTLHNVRTVLGQEAVARGYEAGRMRVEFPGTEYGPYSLKEAEEMKELQGSIGGTMNQVLGHYGIGMGDRYFGEFPYPDQETGAPKLAETIGLVGKAKRDQIVTDLRSHSETAEISDLAIITRDEPYGHVGSKYFFSIVAMGDTVTSNLAAYRKMSGFLKLVETGLEPTQL